MIRVYLQYSYGGFKTFFIEGKENEAVNMEVTNDTSYDFPQDAHRYFQYGGAKILYRYLNDGTLDLIVREIPSIHKDGDGRSIPCAVQFIGDEDDRQTLDFLTTDIVNDIEMFHDFFSKLFRVRGGLRIDGSRLNEWIANHKDPYVCDTNIQQIRNIQLIKSDVILFVPLSSNFGIDEFVTNNVSSELNLTLAQMKRDNCIVKSADLSMIQNKLKIKTDMTPDTVIDEPPIDHLDNGNGIGEKITEVDTRGDDVKIDDGQQVITVVADTHESLSDKKKKNKRNLYVIFGIIVFAIIYIIYSFILH